ncbi:MAG TPA: sugar-transfer associated ATP-grasp domain-containing protein [Candidatus Brocadiaceae bacterium]
MFIDFSKLLSKQKYFHIRNRLKYISLKNIKRKEIHDIYKKTPSLLKFNLSDDLRYKVAVFWKKYGFKVNTLWHRAYIQINGIEDHRYIPEDIFYAFIEPGLNRKDLYHAYVDKNNYDRLFSGVRMPKVIIRNISGKYYDGNYEGIARATVCDFLKIFEGQYYIVKPSLQSSGGKNVMKLHIHSKKLFIDDQYTTLEDIEKIIPRDFLVQEYLEQHAMLKNIYPFSVNTMRIVTLRIHNDIHVIQVILKFGNHGAYVDNETPGGINCRVDNEGMLGKFAVDRYFFKYYKHPYTGSSFENMQIPQFTVALNFVKNLHRNLFYFDMASWDVAVDKDGAPVLIELNLMYQGLTFLQVHNGPLFGDFTERILDEKLGCRNRLK